MSDFVVSFELAHEGLAFMVGALRNGISNDHGKL
jgi:hypothetical protein